MNKLNIFDKGKEILICLELRRSCCCCKGKELTRGKDRFDVGC